MYDSGSGNYSQNGSVDTDLTQLTGYAERSNASVSSGESNGGDYCTDVNSTSLQFSAILFRSESDSDVVFEASDGLIKNASYDHYYTSRARFVGECDGHGYAIWSDTTIKPRVIIRFHK